MKRLLTLFAAALLALSLLACALHIANSGSAPAPPASPGAIRVATHNVHYILLNEADGAWSVSDWERRKDALDAAFKALDADIIAFQEMESFHQGNDGSVNLARDHLLAGNPDYRAAAVGDWREFPSTQPIFYRTARFRLLDQGWYFFSTTPDVIYSRTFDGSYPAFASWARFADRRTGASFTVLNVHLDYSSRSNRRQSVALIVERVAPMIGAGEAVILAGDLNERRGSALIGTLESAGLRFARVEGSTYHFNRGLNLFGAVDHLAVSDGLWVVTGPFVLRKRFDGAWPSDHYPVAADIAPAP